MNHRRPDPSYPRPGRAAALVLTAVLALACISNPRPDTLAHTSTWAVRAPESLPIDVLEYTWIFFNHGRHLRLKGQVRNNSDKVHQSVTLGLTLMDEKGEVVAKGQAYVYPAYLRPGSEGSFEMVTMVSTAGRNLKAGRLVVTAQTFGR